MTFEEIDRGLASWNQRLAAIADNLLELQGDPAYKVLTGSGGTVPLQLTGETARRVLPALKPIEGIFHQFSLLQSVIARAAQLRNDLPVFGREQTLREIEALLLGQSIQLPVDAVALKDRTLLSGVQGTQTIRPEQLLTSMASAFGEARDAVLTVSGAWEELAREVDAAESEIKRLKGAASTANCTTPREIAEAERTLDTLRAEIQSDPLTARNELNAKLLPSLEAADRQLQASLQLHRQIATGHELLAHLRVLESDLGVAVAAKRAKILGCDPSVDLVPTSQLENLVAWLARLEHKFGQERLESIARGLENWHGAAGQTVAVTEQALQRERLPLEMRNELRGRLDALKAKARKYGIAEEDSVASLSQQAEAFLYARPTDLARSATAVEAYERRLLGPGLAKKERTNETGERR